MGRIVLINPNSTEAMTQSMLAQARAAAPFLEFEGLTSIHGPASIQGAADGEVATAPLLALVDEVVSQGAAGIIIGCFDDTALAEAARRAACPVIGIGQAAYHFAALQQVRFSVVTTLPVSIPILEQNIQALGLAGYLGRVRAAGVPVLALEEDREAATQLVLAEAQDAAREDGVEAIILGCGGMVQVTQAVERALDLRVIDPVTCAAQCFGWLLARELGFSARSG